MSAPEVIKKLVTRFKENEKQYTNSRIFDEENTKQEFINPFFEALGWDVQNKNNRALQYKDVEFEKSLNIKGKSAAPDYSFRVGGVPKFYVEAKKPSVNIKDDRNPAYQIKRYAWSSGLKLSVLTDFEELAIYETVTRPELRHSPSIGRVRYYHYSDYIEKWDEIYNILSKDAVLSGKYDNFINDESNIKKKGTSSVDNEFLKEISEWRVKLARNIALRNPELNIHDLNYAVQLIIDRIIFLRICEDRDIEQYGTLEKLIKETDIYQKFCSLCLKADDKYNSGLFHFHHEENMPENVDTFTLNLTIDDAVFKEIFKNLYYPNCPYEFSVINPHILGSIYERFLGSVIRLTKGHQAKVELKDEVKKAGGVYYTPQYIVRYIVENTVGKLVEGKTPAQISKIRILDPACGSGSFLLGAYQYLLEYHARYYSQMDKPPKNVLFKDHATKTLRLTIDEKKRILKNNIYGVDIDANAVEVSKLSLLLQVLDGEAKQLQGQQLLKEKRVLPNLADNIKCGNSLIGTDILETEDLTHEEILKLNPFDWREEYKKVFENGGFDVVIGNPPYVSVETMDNLSKSYYQLNYNTFIKRSDLYTTFIELSQKLLSKKYYSFIIPSTIFTNISYKKLRNLILDNNELNTICYTGNKIFKEANVDTTILIMNKQENKQINITNALDFNNKTSFTVKQDYFKTFDNIISIDSPKTVQIMNKLFNEEYDTVKSHFKIFQGIVTGNNKAFIFNNFETAIKENIESELLHPLIYGKDINQYEVEKRYAQILYIDNTININDYPNAKKWLKQFKLKTKYKLHRPRDKNELNYDEKLLIQRTRNERLKKRIIATIDNKRTYTAESLWNIIPKTNQYSLYFLLGLLNSKLINYLFSTKYLNLGVKKDYLNNIQFPKLTLQEQETYEKLAKHTLKLHEQLLNCKSPHETQLLKKQIKITEDKINKLIYELYDLTNDEIKIIEYKK